MNKKDLLKVLGITLFLFAILFFVANKTSFGSMTQASISFLNINETIPDANFFQWEIESSQDFMLSVWIEDIHGNNITMPLKNKS